VPEVVKPGATSTLRDSFSEQSKLRHFCHEDLTQVPLFEVTKFDFENNFRLRSAFSIDDGRSPSNGSGSATGVGSNGSLIGASTNTSSLPLVMLTPEEEEERRRLKKEKKKRKKERDPEKKKKVHTKLHMFITIVRMY